MSTALIIPTSVDPNVPDYTQRTVLEGRDYFFRFLWNQRNCHWTISIEDGDGNMLASGIRVVSNWPLLRLKSDPRLPPGELYAIDGGEDEDPDLEDLGARVKLVYIPSTAAAV